MCCHYSLFTGVLLSFRKSVILCSTGCITEEWGLCQRKPENCPPELFPDLKRKVAMLWVVLTDCICGSPGAHAHGSFALRWEPESTGQVRPFPGD
ncbi:TPA: hypothetical protein MIR92_19015 [Klebsiella pneumoniae]|nr:hypothetical protein [Klebsiella pneumoniae]